MSKTFFPISPTRIRGIFAGLLGPFTLESCEVDGKTATNTSRIVLPADTTVNLAALTRKQGVLAFDTTLTVPAYDDGTQFIPLNPTTNGIVTVDNSIGNVTVAVGTTLNHFNLNIQPAHTYTVNGTLVTGNIVVQGAIFVPGSLRVLY